MSVSGADIVFVVTTKKSFLAFRVPPDLKRDSGNRKQGSEEPFAGCELLLYEGAHPYKKERPRFLQRLVGKQKARVKTQDLGREDGSLLLPRGCSCMAPMHERQGRRLHARRSTSAKKRKRRAATTPLTKAESRLSHRGATDCACPARPIFLTLWPAKLHSRTQTVFLPWFPTSARSRFPPRQLRVDEGYTSSGKGSPESAHVGYWGLTVPPSSRLRCQASCPGMPSFSRLEMQGRRGA
jgi:hypothetical protein